MAVGNLQGGTDVVAGSLGENEYALTAGSGRRAERVPVVPGRQRLLDRRPRRPLRQRPDRDHRGWRLHGRARLRNDLRRTAATSASSAPTGNAGPAATQRRARLPVHNQRDRRSSPAVGQFLARLRRSASSSAPAPRSPAVRHQPADRRQHHCNLQWAATLDGNTASSPALADVLGNGQLQVVEGTDNDRHAGSVYALNGANGAPIWQHADVGRGHRLGRHRRPRRSGYQDVLAPTVNGVDVLDGKTGSRHHRPARQHRLPELAAVTDDPNGTIGITLAGYQASRQLHLPLRDRRLERLASSTRPGPGRSSTTTPSSPATPARRRRSSRSVHRAGRRPNGYYLAAADGGIFSYGNLPFCGSTGTSAQPAGGRHGGHPQRRRLLGVATRRRALRLRQRHRSTARWAANRSTSRSSAWRPTPDGKRLLGGRVRRRALRLRHAPFYGSMGGQPLNQPDRGHGGHARRQGLLAGGVRRRALRLRQRPASTARWAASR